MTPTERGLIDAILAEPDDEGPRRIYADFLIAEGGDRARWGELILIEAELARTPKRTPRYQPLLGARNERLSALPVSRLPGRFGYRHGLPMVLSISLRTLLAQLDDRFEQQPWLVDLRLVTWYGPDADQKLEQLAASPHLNQLRALRVESAYGRFGDNGALALARSPHLDRLRRLDLVRHAITPAGADALRRRFGDVLGRI